MVDQDPGLEINIRKRKELLLRSDIDQMQKEFLDKKEKCNVKIKKDNPQQEILISNAPRIKQLKGKKKIKDVISLDIPISSIKKEENKEEKKESLFGQNIKSQLSSININTIEKETGLPNTFKLDAFSHPPKKNLEITSKKEETINTQKENKRNLQKYEKDDFYDKISEENLEKIKKMSKKELEETQKEIMMKIPSSLIKKMKGGLFHKKFQEKYKSKEPEKIAIGYNYVGESRSIREGTESEKLSNKIDFAKLTFNEMDLSKKFFSLLEIYNLISSSNPIQISLGLKILFNLLNKKLYLQSEEFANQLYSYINALFFLIDHSNINVRLESLKCFTFLLKEFFYEDYKKFKFSTFFVGNFPIQFINSVKDNLAKEISKTKEKFLQLIQNNNKDIFYLIQHNDNVEINKLYKEVLFYICYLNGKIPDKLQLQIIQDGISLKLNSNQKLMKIILLLGDKAKIENYASLIKNQYYYQYILALRGISDELTKSKTSLTDNNNHKIYSINKELLISHEKIPFSHFSSETDLLYISKILLSKINYSLRKIANDEDDVCLSMVDEDSEIRFYEKKYQESIEYLTSNKNSNLIQNFYELIPKFEYLNSFFLLWYKNFKYPKILSFKKILISLDEIIELFPLMNTYLEKIESYANNTMNKNEKTQKLYLFNSFLKLCFNYIRCFIKNHNKNYEIKNFSLFLIKLSELINKGDEYYYHKLVKYLKNVLSRKTEKNKNILGNIQIDFNELDVDLNFYLESNEELRKSTYSKKIFSLMSTDKMDCLIYDNENKGSKYFPFESNFINQILFNDKAKSEIKISYLIMLMIFWYDEDYTSQLSVTPFEIAIRFLMSFKFPDFESNTRLLSVYEKFFNIIVFGNGLNLSLLNTPSNKLLLSNFFSLYEDNLSFTSTKILYPMILVMIIFLHTEQKGKKNMNSNQFEKNIELVCYENLFGLVQINIKILEDKQSEVLQFLLRNLSINFTSFYESLILTYIKNKCYEIKKQNVIGKYISELIKLFEIQKDDYSSFLKNNTKLKEMIFNKLFIK